MIRKWLKEILRQVIREEIEYTPLIIAARAPTENDVYAKGTTWICEGEMFMAKSEMFMAKKVTVEWEKISDGIPENK